MSAFAAQALEALVAEADAEHEAIVSGLLDLLQRAERYETFASGLTQHARRAPELVRQLRAACQSVGHHKPRSTLKNGTPPDVEEAPPPPPEAAP